MGQPNNRASFVKHQLWGKSIFCNLVRSHHLKGYDSENMYPQGVWYLIFDFLGGLILIFWYLIVFHPNSPPPPPPICDRLAYHQIYIFLASVFICIFYIFLDPILSWLIIQLHLSFTSLISLWVLFCRWLCIPDIIWMRTLPLRVCGDLKFT